MNLSRLLTITVLSCGMLACTERLSSSSEEATEPLPTEEAIICLRAEPAGLNPILTVQNISRYVVEQIFQTLNTRDALTFEPRPMLASLPEVQELANGGESYTYLLDSAATWPDGSPILASDVVFSLKAIMNPLVNAGPYRPYYEMIDDIKIDPDNDRRFTVLTDRPYILSAQAIGDLYIYPEYAYDPEGLLKDIPLSDIADPATVEQLVVTEPRLRGFAEYFNSPELSYEPSGIVGSGPYELVEWEDGQRLQLRRRTGYWASDRSEPYLVAIPESLTFSIIPDATTAVNAMRDRAVDVVIDLPADQFQQLRNDEYLNRYYAFDAVAGLRYFAILLNQDNSLLTDSLTRQALAYAVNTERMIEQLLPELARRVVGPVLPSKSYYNRDLELIPFDLDRAASLLAEAGWQDSDSNGVLDRTVNGERQELSFQLLSYPNPTSEAVCLVVAQGAAKVGVQIEVVKQEPRALVSELNAGTFAAAFYGQGFEPMPDDFAQSWSSLSVPPMGTNRGNFSNPEADSLIQLIATSTDTARRVDLYRRFQEIVYANQPMVFLYSPFDRVVVARRFQYSLHSHAPNLYFNALRPAELSQSREPL